MMRKRGNTNTTGCYIIHIFFLLFFWLKGYTYIHIYIYIYIYILETKSQPHEQRCYIVCYKKDQRGRASKGKTTLQAESLGYKILIEGNNFPGQSISISICLPVVVLDFLEGQLVQQVPTIINDRSMKYGCVSRFGCGCETQQFLKKQSADAAGCGN